jgi:glycosyltransferase
MEMVYMLVTMQKKKVRNRIGGAYDFEKLKSGWLPLHPTVYLRKSVPEKLGYYDYHSR